MEYGQFAHIYDRFMYDQPYDTWAQIVQRYIPAEGSILDVATGTGKLLQLVTANEKVGVDLSEDMLAVAQHNVGNAQFITQDMTELNLAKSFDTITCLCDSLNYLQDEDAIARTFQNVYAHLKREGTFILMCIVFRSLSATSIMQPIVTIYQTLCIYGMPLKVRHHFLCIMI